MEGHLYQRGRAKVWYLRYWLPRIPGKKRVQKNARIGEMSKTEAGRKKRQILRDLDEGISSQVSSEATVTSFLEQWLTAVEGRLASSTFVRYRDIVHRHIVPNLGHLKLQNVRPEHLRQLYDQLQTAGLSGRTALHVHRVFHTALHYAVREERMLKENVCDRVKAPRPEDRDLKPMKKADLELLLAASAKTRLEIPMVVAATSGLRRGELLALRWQDIDFDKMSIFVSASLEDTRLHGVRLKGPKSKSSRRFIPLAPSVTQLLRAHKQEQEDLKKSSGGAYHDLGFVFSNPDGKPWPPNSFTSQFKKLARSVGLTDFRFHDVRHFFATVSLANGHPIKEVQTLLGHANPSVTLSIYARNLEGLGRKAVDELAESLAPTGHPSANVAG